VAVAAEEVEKTVAVAAQAGAAPAVLTAGVAVVMAVAAAAVLTSAAVVASATDKRLRDRCAAGPTPAQTDL
jgi:hypothetical protein